MLYIIGVAIMKRCNTCGKLKELDDFHKKSSSPDGHSNKCKQCQKEYQEEHYQQNKERIYQRNLSKRIYLAQEVDKLKDFPCKDCGIKYEPCCMEFDHLSDKIMAVSKMIHETFSLDNIQKEIAKCELVCVLCHKDRTYQRLQQKEKKQLYPCYDRNRAIIILAKSQPCNICSIQYQPWQMEFDHFRDKDIAVGLMLGVSQQRLENEIDKCQVLCALCHRRKTKQDLW
jgi:hypothetical protein